MSKHLLLIPLLCLVLLILPAGAASVITSPDGLVTLSTENALDAALGVAAPIPPSGEWVPVGEAYLLNPPDLVIAAPATLTFTLPSELAVDSDAMIFVAYWGNGGWERLPSRIQETASGTVISAPAGMPGVYTLMTQAGAAAEASPLPTEAGLVAGISLSAVLFASLIVLWRKP
jgi:hypothetical protein